MPVKDGAVPWRPSRSLMLHGSAIWDRPPSPAAPSGRPAADGSVTAERRSVTVIRHRWPPPHPRPVAAPPPVTAPPPPLPAPDPPAPPGRPRGRRHRLVWSDADNERLAAIMERHESPLPVGAWEQIRNEFGKYTVDQVRDHWRSRAKATRVAVRPLGEPPIVAETVAERTRTECRRIAAELGGGVPWSLRSVGDVLTRVNRVLKKLGIRLENQDDIDLLPDYIVEGRCPDPAEAPDIITAFEAAKRRRDEAAS